jgi:hypothetical protein
MGPGDCGHRGALGRSPRGTAVMSLIDPSRKRSVRRGESMRFRSYIVRYIYALLFIGPALHLRWYARNEHGTCALG